MAFLDRHRKYLNFIKKMTNECDRSIMWASISDEFLTDIVDGKPKLNSQRQKSYFVDFDKQNRITIFDRTIWFVAKVIDVASQRVVNWLLRNKDHRYRKAFMELSLHKKKTKYTISDHPIFGADKCDQPQNLMLQWNNYLNIYSLLKKDVRVLEIGAGAGILTMLQHHDLNAKVVIVDLPEMISYSSACIHSVFPDAKLLLPNEVEEGMIDYDFAFLTPNQIDLLPENYFDIAQNSCSMCEMRHEDIDTYFKLIQRVVKHEGLFYCSNRAIKNPANMGVGDCETRDFFKYPWDKNNIDVLLEVDKYKYEWTHKSLVHLTINRLQRVMKKKEIVKG